MTQVQLTFGPLLLAPGIKRSEAFGYLFISAVLGCMQAFMALIQPYVFTEQLGIPAGEQGRLVGALAATQQAALLIFVMVFGALSDRLGRRLFLLLAMAGMTLGMLLYPFATMVLHLFAIRFFFGIASTCFAAGAPAMRFDITDNNSRGRILSLSLIIHAIANTVLINGLGTRLPAWLADTHGLTGLQAGRYTFYVIGVIGAVGFLGGYLFLRRDRPRRAVKAPLSIGARESMANLRQALAYARSHPRFWLVILASALLRAASAVLVSFLALWVVNAARAQGLSSTQALHQYGTIAIVVTAADLGFSFIAGFVADRVNRFRLLLVSVAGVAVAFSLVIFVRDVTGWEIIAVVILINLAEAFQQTSSQALIGQETPAHLRGSAYGFIAWIGTISLIVTSLIGGYLVDQSPLGYRAPFLLISGLSAGFLLLAGAYLSKRRWAS